MSKENRFVIQVDPLEIEDDAIFDNKELRLYECQSDMMSDICSLLNKQDKQILDLEAKLAKSDMEVFMLTKNNECFKNDIKQLKQQLAEKDQAIESLQEINQSLGHTCNNDAKEIERLREQLEEKEREIEKLKIILSMQAVQVPEKQRLNLITTNCIQYNPNQTAIAELEKVKDYIRRVIPKTFLIEKFIDQQIKSLKGEK